ncbi:hypothetical protein FJR38_02400 [Anabaena sp. UHCC 0253]|uniref:hypothetical protein n=1 Tax=Anabaena sp. UHCC 0253 TaxID=2590019 RepID=UPI0014487780|nr:hypothetical protein [Anabaena sp. UHCC 0253]MTJ51615.1 hypothetical protein [Anabaena sp. UHCC 0253]
MKLKTSVYNIVDQINKLHLEDPKVYDYWDDLTKTLSADEKLTIQFLESLDDKNTVNTISAVFEDVAYNLQSLAFINYIESLQTKFPDLLLEHMVDAARNTINMDDAEV